ncbi:MAG TPA: amidohydrolase [Longimicrobiales bacterium]|nr:amidohydrolase [Longimicrobiales bacterium]
MLLVLADRVHTFAGDGGAADALLLRRGRIIAVGRGDALRAEVPGAAVLDLRGTTLTPGLTDSHIHLLEWALSRREPDLSEATSPEDAARLLSGGVGDRESGGSVAPTRPLSHSPTPWLRGRGWNAHRWGGAYPHRRILDAVIADRPVALQSHDMHALWVNTRALREAGIDRDTPDPDGGRILRDEHGEPTGVLLETAAQLLVRRIPPPSEADVAAAVLDGQRALHRLGITGIHSFPAIHLTAPDTLPLLERLRAEDRLRLRVLQHIPLERLDDALRLGLRSGFGGEWIRVGAVKMFLDGALGSRTALLREPYENAGDDRGVEVLPPAEFRDAVARAAAGGLATTVHAIGDAAVSLALDVLADPGLRAGTLPHRIEHVQLCPPERFADAARAGIVCSMQPAHLITDWRPAERHWGRRSREAYAFRSLLRGGEGESGGVGEPVSPHSPTLPLPHSGPKAVLAFGSDAPVEPVDPRLAFWAATRRQSLDAEPAAGWYPEERLAMADVIRAYTAGAALAAGEAARRGHLGVGADADFVAWSADPLAAEGAALLEIRCLAAVVAGEVVWNAAGS